MSDDATDTPNGLKITEIPMILGSENWSTVDVKFHTDPVIASARTLHSDMLKAYQGIVLTHRDVLADVNQTPATNMQRSYQHAAKASARIMEAAERAISRVAGQIVDIDHATSRVPDPPSDAVIRITSDRLAALSPADRSARIRDAIEHDQHGTLAVALVVGDSWVHGLSDAERSLFLDSYRRKNYAGALERRAMRLQSRVQRLRPEWGHLPESIECFFNWPRFNQGGDKALERWLDRRPKAKLAIFDTWNFVKPARVAGRNMYDEDVDALAPVKRIADERSIAILLILHLKKGKEDDIFHEISGSTGITGTADTIMHLARQRGQADAILTTTSRVMPEAELALQFDSGVWTLLGDADEYRHGKEKTLILTAIKEAGRPMSPAELARDLDEQRETVKKRMSRMANDGYLIARGGGKYDLPPKA